jgi:DNA anti-recombination protein RmuC
MEKFKLLRTEHTKATKAIGQAAGYVDEIAATMTDAIEAVGRQIDSIVDEPGESRAAA